MKHVLTNPIIPGFYPDPSICRVGDDFYLVCSSFELCPGIPLFHSKDLANWEQVCYVMTPENGFHVEKNSGVGGVMAPTIRYHKGTFYIINCNFADKGNFIVTAKDPAGPWSQPHWLTDVPGIDASFFFDHHDRCYIMGTGNVWPDGKGGMRQGIWAAEYDIEKFCLVGEPVALWGGAMAGVASPEAPHIYHIGDWYYLLIAEGGTEQYHSATIARSRSVLGPYEGFRGNPVLTVRHMGKRALIQNAGHADLVDLPDGSWYAVFLASRLIGAASKNLGRETYIVPVVWEEEWPLFSPETGKVEWEYPAPESLPWTAYDSAPGMDDFADGEFGLQWSFWGKPVRPFWSFTHPGISIACLPQKLAEPLQPMSMDAKEHSDRNYAAFLARRRRQPHCRFRAAMQFVPEENESAGIAIVQAMNHQMHLEIANDGGKRVVQLSLYTSEFEVPPYLPGFTSVTNRKVLASREWDGGEVVLEMELEQNAYRFSFGPDEANLTLLCEADGLLINPEKVGCMTGEVLGIFATSNGGESGNQAHFAWTDYQDL
ncbi:MAG TPA: glycoside hydrolase family 43 protein [Lachnospiraceae bacterium]|nr:glycoside hydrolase family 43 protein [Lachnospiraceae bacterium]